MPVLDFVLSPEAVLRVHDALTCLAKFSEVVDLEASPERLVLTALNTSRTAYASFAFEKDAFFQSYHFSPLKGVVVADASNERFTCQLYNKALYTVFKGRAREGDAAVERCEVSLQDRPDKTECRLIVQMVCRHAVKKTYKLNYESVEISRALFNKDDARNRWTISAHSLKAFSEYFGAKTEHLDIYSEGGRVSFTSYTEKITHGNEILKQPLQTSIAVDTLDFEEFSVEEKVHIGINVKDFRAIVNHAESLKATISAFYSYPTRPFQLAYVEHGMHCEFILTTIGQYRGSTTPAPSASRSASSRPSARIITKHMPSQTSVRQEQNRQGDESMPPPLRPVPRSFVQDSASQRPLRPPPPQPRASIDEQSLFLNDDDDEHQWDEKNYTDDGDQLGWDDSYAPDIRTGSMRQAHGSMARTTIPIPSLEADDGRIPPTQPMSQINGLFD